MTGWRAIRSRPQRKVNRLQHRGLAAIVVTDQYRMLWEQEVRTGDSAKVLDDDAGDTH